MQTTKSNKGNPGRQILVVDDEPAITTTLKLLLELDGHQVQTVNSGQEALLLLEHAKFDLVTTDFSMAGMKGDTLAVAIKRRLPHQRILMISSNGAIAKAAGDPLPGVDLVIAKPFYLGSLTFSVGSYMAGSRSLPATR